MAPPSEEALAGPGNKVAVHKYPTAVYPILSSRNSNLDTLDSDLDTDIETNESNLRALVAGRIVLESDMIDDGYSCNLPTSSYKVSRTSGSLDIRIEETYDDLNRTCGNLVSSLRSMRENLYWNLTLLAYCHKILLAIYPPCNCLSND